MVLEVLISLATKIPTFDLTGSILWLLFFPLKVFKKMIHEDIGKEVFPLRVKLTDDIKFRRKGN